jgi:uncharacterized protein
MSVATETIRRRFGVRVLPGPAVLEPIRPPGAGEILLIGGHSGAGKSTLLRQVIGRLPRGRIVRLDRLHLPDEPAVDLVPLTDVEDRLGLLSRVGLAEVYSWLRRPGELSDGQRWRLRLAIGLARARGRAATLVCDEFASALDTLTALLVCRLMRRMLGVESGLSAILVTGREELYPALAPERIAWCDFGVVRETTNVAAV